MIPLLRVPFTLMGSFQLYGPVGVVEELLPATVAGLAEVNADKRIMFRLGGFLDKSEASLFGRPAAFCHVTFGAGADHIFPI